MRFLARFFEFFRCVCLWTVQHFVGHSAVAALKHSVGHSLCSAECGGAQCRKPSQNSVGHSGREAPSFMRRAPSPPSPAGRGRSPHGSFPSNPGLRGQTDAVHAPQTRSAHHAATILNDCSSWKKCKLTSDGMAVIAVNSKILREFKAPR